MASLFDGEVAVNEAANQSIYGPSGRRKRSECSAFLSVGGSSCEYDVTINFNSGHACIDPRKVAKGARDKRCFGNANGKGQKYGAENQRDTRNPIEWCKHVIAAMADVEKLTEAQELSVLAFNPAPRVVEAKVRVLAPVVAFPEVPNQHPALKSDAELLADSEAETERLREKIGAAKTEELRTALATLVKEHGHMQVENALDETGS